MFIKGKDFFLYLIPSRNYGKTQFLKELKEGDEITMEQDPNKIIEKFKQFYDRTKPANN
jgi:hypothetical protein